MSLYEGFLLLKMLRVLLHSSSGAGGCMWVYCSVWVCTGVLVRLEHYSAPTCIRIPPNSSRTAPIHQHTPRQSSTATYNRQLLWMNVIAFEACWAIKNLHKVTSSWFNLFNYVTDSLFDFEPVIARICKIVVKPKYYNLTFYINTRPNRWKRWSRQRRVL